MKETHEVPGGLTRRTALRGGLAVVAGAAAVAAGGAPAHALATTSYNYIGTGSYRAPTRYRKYSSGSFVSQHPSVTSFPYGSGFHLICDAWANTYGSVLRYMTKGSVGVSWFGCVGVYVAKPGSHGSGNAFDLSGILHTNGSVVDAATDHLASAGVVRNRHYIGAAWAGRKHMAETGIVGSHSSHGNHMHFGKYKNGSSSLLLTKGQWDALMIQYSCRAFMGFNTVVDGSWGSQTTSHYNELMRRLGLNAWAPFSSTAALQSLAHTLTAKGVVAHSI